MKVTRTALLLMMGASLVSGALAAQDTGRWEVGLFGGGYFGTRIFLDPAAEIRIGNSASYGGRVAYSLDRSFALEATYSHTQDELLAKDRTTGRPLAPAARVDVDSYDLDTVYTFGRGRARGTFSLGLGAMTLRPFVPDVRAEQGTGFTANIGLGGKLFLSEHLALRADARYRWRLRDHSAAELVCGEEGCYGVTTNLYSSAEVTGGVSFRFGGRGAERLTAEVPDSKPVVPATSAAEKSPKTRFFTAAAEVAALEAVPWAFDRYVADEKFARISIGSLNDNLETGFTYDRDDFRTNQFLHPYHGGLFFNAARSNGYGYWESGAFTLVGSFIWECAMENTPPSINDLVNTTIGGMALGEITRRTAVMLRDNTARGAERFFRELGGAVLDPVGAFNRLTHGDMTWSSPNPDERFPSSFHATVDAGYRHVGDEDAKAIVSLETTYGDPFAGEIRQPFETFALHVDFNSGGELASRVEGRGILKGWELTDPSSSVRHIFAFFQEYEYFANGAQVFGAQSYSATLLSRFKLGKSFTATTEVGLVGFPLAGIQTLDFAQADAAGPTRTYDYGPGGGARAGGRIDFANGPSAAATYSLLFSHTADGVSDSSTLQLFNAFGRVPLFWRVGAGGGYSWYSRKTAYPGFFEARRTQSEWRVYLSIEL